MFGYEPRVSQSFGATGETRTVWSPQGPWKANHMLTIDGPDGTKQKEFGLYEDAIAAMSTPVAELFP